MYKNITATVQTIECVQRHARDGERAARWARALQPGAAADAPPPVPLKLEPLQKIIAFGPQT